MQFSNSYTEKRLMTLSAVAKITNSKAKWPNDLPGSNRLTQGDCSTRPRSRADVIWMGSVPWRLQHLWFVRPFA
jgi:hypothetical protein